ncbi:MAG: SMP-30/gluconolactonase/LRE family protein [Bacteroidetes bacterium]|nr:SMP-30/gluconolactonase/LRE family protein [Bacteroidota bacterium]
MTRIFQLLLITLFLAGCNRLDTGYQIGTFQAESERFWELVSRDALAERIGVRFGFTEGPALDHDGSLLFSDIPGNTIYRLKGKKFKEFRKPSYQSNGLLIERDGSVLACEHGSRSLTRIAADGSVTTEVDNYRGRRLNSPNDLCLSSQGVLFFTDSPWGLPGRNEDPDKELPYNGVYMYKKGELTLVDSTLSWPNGIALSPDEKYLYVSNFEGSQGSDESEWEAFWMRYELDVDGKVVERSRFFQATDLNLPGDPDGMKVDRKGNLFLTGPGGILVVSPEGEHLGTIGLPLTPSNLTFGPGEKVLYVTARTTVVKIRLR